MKHLYMIRSLMAVLAGAFTVIGSAHAGTFQYRQPVVGLVPAPPKPTGSVGCTAPWGASVASGTAVTAYLAAAVPFGSTCASEQRTCLTGTLTGSFGQQSCSVRLPHDVHDFGAYWGWSDGTYAASCNAYRTEGATGSGVYRIKVGDAAFDVYCDMVSAGGGWTRIVRQYEASPVTNWAGAVNGNSYALAAAQIPAHSQVGLGKEDIATSVDYFNWTYTTGDIYPAVSVTGLKAGMPYMLHRSITGFFSDHSTSGSYGTNCYARGNGNWCNTLGLSSGASLYWTFSPQNDHVVAYRGYNMDGVMKYETSESYAWTVWVR